MRTLKEPMKRKDYEEALGELQVELCALQEWVKHKGLRVVVVFEGRDAAGRGGAINAITERVSPRVFRVVALPAPSDPGEVAVVPAALRAPFPGGRRDRDLCRSWYNRAGVEYVISFPAPALPAARNASDGLRTCACR